MDFVVRQSRELWKNIPLCTRSSWTYNCPVYSYINNFQKERYFIMKKNIVSSFLLLVILFSIPVYSQSNNPKKLLEAVKNKFNKITDYSVDAKIKLNIELFKVPESNAKIYFKKPDKVKMEAKGFAMLPKQGLNFSPNKLLSGNIEVVYVRKETVSNIELNVIKVIPLSDTSDVLLSTIWIDAKNNVIRKVVSITKKSGALTISLKYNESTIKHGLPAEAEFVFNTGDLPKERKNDDLSKENQNQKRAKLEGSVIVYYSNYKINKGLSDAIFAKDKLPEQ